MNKLYKISTNMPLCDILNHIKSLRKRNRAKCFRIASELYPLETNKETLTLVNENQLEQLNEVSHLLDIEYFVEDITSELIYGELDEVYKNDCMLMSIIHDFLMKNVHRGDVLNKIKMLGLGHMSEIDFEILSKSYRTDLD